MTSILTRLFKGLAGKSDGDDGQRAGGDRAEAYAGFLIHPAPEREGQQWRIAGVITEHRDEGDRERTFTRADTFATHEEAVTSSVRKAKQIIDERGAQLFADGAATGRA